MTFASIGLVAAAIAGMTLPILIHFFLRRKNKPVEWAAMALLRRALERTARTRRFDQWLLLVIRCLLVLATGLAIAGPLLPKSSEDPSFTQSSTRERAIVLDDGVAQQVVRGGSTGWEDAKKRAVGLIDQLQPGDRIGILRGVGSRAVVWPPSSDLDAVRSEVQLATASYEGSDVVAAAASAAEGGRDVIVLSDFRAGSFGGSQGGTSEPSRPSDAPQSTRRTTTVLLEPHPDQQLNVQVVAVETRSSGPQSSREQHPLRVRLQREGTALPKSTSTIEVRSDGGLKNTLRVAWDSGQVLAQVDGTMTALAKEQRVDFVVEARILESDAQPADNAVYGVVSAEESIRVILLDRALPDQPSDNEDTPASWLLRALVPIDGTDIAVEVVDPAALDTARLRGTQAVVVLRPDSMDATGWGVLSQAVQDGLVVWVFAPTNKSVVWGADFQRAFSLGWLLERATPNQKADSQEEFTERRIEAGKTPHPLLAQMGSELDTLIQPVVVHESLGLRVPTNSGDVVLSLSDGSPLLACAQPTNSRGSVLLMSTALVTGWTSLPTKPFMVPFVQEVLRQSIARVERATVERMGGIANIPGAITLEPILHMDGGGLPEARSIPLDSEGRATQPIQVPGVYSAVDARNRRIAWLVANVDLRSTSIRATPNGEAVALFQGMDCIIPDPPTVERAVEAAPGVPVDRGDEKELPIAKALDGVSLAPWFFLAAMACLLGESWLARRASAGATTHALLGDGR